MTDFFATAVALAVVGMIGAGAFYALAPIV